MPYFFPFLTPTFTAASTLLGASFVFHRKEGEQMWTGFLFSSELLLELFLPFDLIKLINPPFKGKKLEQFTYVVENLFFFSQSHDNVTKGLNGHLIICASLTPIKSHLIKLNVKNPSSRLTVRKGLIGEDRHDICFPEHNDWQCRPD